MQTALKTTTKVLAGGKIEFAAPQLPVNELVEVIIMFPISQEFPATVAKRSALEILTEAPGPRIFKTAADVETYLREERDTWEH